MHDAGENQDQERIDNLEALVDSLDRIFACYRTQSRPSGRLLDTIKECRRRRAVLAESGSRLAPLGSDERPYDRGAQES